MEPMDVTLHGKKTTADVMLKRAGEVIVPLRAEGHFSTVRDERAKKDWRDAILQSFEDGGRRS